MQTVSAPLSEDNIPTICLLGVVNPAGNVLCNFCTDLTDHDAGYVSCASQPSKSERCSSCGIILAERCVCSPAVRADAAFLRCFPSVADTIQTIRACDVYRLLDLVVDASGCSPDEAIAVLAGYRPDLGAMVAPPVEAVAKGGVR